VRAGKLRHRVTLQRNAPVSDGAGGEAGNWTTLATRKAAIEPQSGGEKFAADQVVSQETVRIRMRYDSVTSTITTKDRIVFGVRVFDIKYPFNRGERNREMVFLCEEVHG